MHTDSQSTTNDSAVYIGVYRVLLFGMYASTILFVIAVGLTTLATHEIDLRPGAMLPEYHWQRFIRQLLNGNPVPCAFLATLVLIATPIARVVVSLAGFARQKEWHYVLVTAVVLSTIAVTVLLFR